LAFLQVPPPQVKPALHSALVVQDVSQVPVAALHT